MDLELCGDHEGRRLECLDENTRGAWGVNGSGVNTGLVWLHGLGLFHANGIGGAGPLLWVSRSWVEKGDSPKPRSASRSMRIQWIRTRKINGCHAKVNCLIRLNKVSATTVTRRSNTMLPHTMRTAGCARTLGKVLLADTAVPSKIREMRSPAS